MFSHVLDLRNCPRSPEPGDGGRCIKADVERFGS